MLKFGKYPFLFVSFFLMSACFLAYGLLIAQTMASFIGNTVQCYGVTVGVMFCVKGMTQWYDQKTKKSPRSVASLWDAALFVCLSYFLGTGALCLSYIYLAREWFQDLYWSGLVVFYTTYFFVMWAVAHCAGVLSSRIREKFYETHDEKSCHHKIVIAQSCGYLAAALFFALSLRLLVDIITAACVITLFYLLALALFYTQLKTFKGPALRGWVVFLFISLICLKGIINRHGVAQFFWKKYYYYPYADQLKAPFLGNMGEVAEVQRYKGLRHTIDIVKKPIREKTPTTYLTEAYSSKFAHEPGFPREHRLYINNSFRLSTEYEDVYYEYFAHIPVILQQSVPADILVLGGGDGCLIREFLKYPQVRKVTLVVPDRDLVDLAKNHPVLKAVNKGALWDERVDVVYQDIFHYLLRDAGLYDAIYFDSPVPTEYDSSRMYSVELFRLAAGKMKEGGFAALRAPRTNSFIYSSLGREILAENNDWPFYYHTLKAAGFKTILGYASNLEAKNQRALQALHVGLRNHYSSTLGQVGHRGQKTISENVFNLVREYVFSMREGYIFFQREASGGKEPQYKDFEIPLYVLNRQRFFAAFRAPFAYPEELDSSRVNSIMRPTLPSGGAEWVQLPY